MDMTQLGNHQACPGPTGAEAERLMLEIWQSEIACDAVGPDDDFFALGGDSLAAVRIMMRVKETFGVELPISRLLETPILREFTLQTAALAASGSLSASNACAEMEEGIV
jgi:acyl carrier protein